MIGMKNVPLKLLTEKVHFELVDSLVEYEMSYAVSFGSVVYSVEKVVIFCLHVQMVASQKMAQSVKVMLGKEETH